MPTPPSLKLVSAYVECGYQPVYPRYYFWPENSWVLQTASGGTCLAKTKCSHDLLNLKNGWTSVDVPDAQYVIYVLHCITAG